MIGTIHHVGLSAEYVALFDAFYRAFPKPEYFGKIISYRSPDYAFALHEATPEPEDVVLDVGCACSYFVVCLARFAAKVYGVDMIDSYAIKWTVPWVESMTDFEDYRSGKIELIRGNAAELPFADNSVDKVYTFSALEHFLGDDDSLCAAEIARVLKPGGIFVGTVDFNEATEHPCGQDSNCRTYTYASFLDRILGPSALSLTGVDNLADAPIDPDASYVASALFFKLVKP